MNTAITISTEAPQVFSKDAVWSPPPNPSLTISINNIKTFYAKLTCWIVRLNLHQRIFALMYKPLKLEMVPRENHAADLITKDGFMFLVMGFTGKKAARLKEAYIAKFNAMEAELHNKPQQLPASANYAVITYFENGLPVACHPLYARRE